MKRVGIHEYIGCDGTYVTISQSIIIHKYYNRAKRANRKLRLRIRTHQAATEGRT